MHTAPCGLDCDACDLKPESCDGCHAKAGRLWTPGCPIRACCKFTHGLANCAQCAAFPCELIENFEGDRWEHHTAAVGRLRELRGAARATPT
jgi:hypothetical protein